MPPSYDMYENATISNLNKLLEEYYTIIFSWDTPTTQSTYSHWPCLLLHDQVMITLRIIIGLGSSTLSQIAANFMTSPMIKERSI